MEDRHSHTQEKWKMLCAVNVVMSHLLEDYHKFCIRLPHDRSSLIIAKIFDLLCLNICCDYSTDKYAKFFILSVTLTNSLHVTFESVKLLRVKYWKRKKNMKKENLKHVGLFSNAICSIAWCSGWVSRAVNENEAIVSVEKSHNFWITVISRP